MFKIRKGDTVEVIEGKDSGKRGKVLNILPQKNCAIVEGINLVKKHKRKTSQEELSGIVSIEAPINVSNLMIFCKHCSCAVRVGFRVLEDQTKLRICESCKETI